MDSSTNTNTMNSRLISRLKILGIVLAAAQAILFFVAMSSKLTPFANGTMVMLYGALFVYYIVTGLAALKGVLSSKDSMSSFVKVLLLMSGIFSVVSVILFMLMEDMSVAVATVSMILALSAWAMILFVLFFYSGGAQPGEEAGKAGKIGSTLVELTPYGSARNVMEKLTST